MKLLIDLDICIFKGLTVCKDKYYPGLRACDWIVSGIIERFDNPEYELILSGSNNFRKDISKTYKSNRKPEDRPRYLHDARQYFIKYWNATVAHGMEADDYIGINHDENTIIVSTDKDMLQLGGKIYNFTKRELFEVEDPMKYFWMQTLCGDKSDSVPGVKNPAKAHFKNPPNFTWDVAEEYLKDKTNQERKQMVEEIYKYTHGDDWYSTFDTSARLLWLRRSPNDEYYYHL